MKNVPENTGFPYCLRLVMLGLLVFAGVMEGRGQEVNNRLLGYFNATSDTLLYNYFSFDANGKVDITGMGDGYYFQKGDSLIVYPDKSIFKFLLKGDKLYGVSEWVNGGVWQLIKDSVVENRRTSAAAADRVAFLLNQYYEIRGENRMLFLNAADDAFVLKMKSLCDSGLSKACLDYAGLKIMEDMGGIGALLGNKAVRQKKEADPEILAVIEKSIRMGDMEGYAVLGGYYAALQHLTKAKEVLEKGGELGCRRCIWAAFSIAMEEDAKKTEAAADEKEPASKTIKRKQ